MSFRDSNESFPDTSDSPLINWVNYGIIRLIFDYAPLELRKRYVGDESFVSTPFTAFNVLCRQRRSIDFLVVTMKANNWLRVILIFIAFNFNVESVFAAWTITTIADNQTQMPGHTENFLQFPSTAVIIDNGQVVFKGIDGGLDWDQWQGIYSYQNGSITIVADKNTAMQGDPDERNFVGFGAPSLDNGNILFGAINPYTPVNWGLYLKTNSGISKVVDFYTSMPEIGGFFNISYTSSHRDIQNTDLVFTSGGEDYLWSKIGGTLDLIADRSTTIPGKAVPFNNFRYPNFGLNGIVFTGEDNTNYEGLFLYDNGTIETLIDTDTAIPYMESRTFDSFWTSCSDTNSVYFHSQNVPVSGQYCEGIYSLADGVLEPIVDWRTAMPDREGYFDQISGNFSHDRDNVAFLGRKRYATPAQQYNLYAIFDGHLSLVFELVDMLSCSAFSNGQIVFVAQNTLYLAEYTPPGCEGADYVEDGFVDGNDLSYFAENWLGDLAYTDIAPEISDGIVNFADFAILAKYWQCQCE